MLIVGIIFYSLKIYQYFTKKFSSEKNVAVTLNEPNFYFVEIVEIY